MRHASIQTTRNLDGQAMSNSKWEANSKVLDIVLKPNTASAQNHVFFIGRYWEPIGATGES